MKPLTVKDVVDSLADYPVETPVPAPPYEPREGSRAALVVPSMERHMSNEGFQLFLGLQAGGYSLHGHGLGLGTDVKKILDQKERPGTMFVQDPHEFNESHLAKPEEKFHGWEMLASRPDVFIVTPVKDTHRQYESAKRYAVNMGAHAVVIYYNKDIVLRTLNWLRPEHVIRTWHTLDPGIVPTYRARDRLPCLLSGALGGAYPLRTKIHNANLPHVVWLPHPGYDNKGTHTGEYLHQLGRYKVAICTASKFGYCLRKIAEATACGCRVITDLPSDEVVPCIEANLVRVHPSIGVGEVSELIHDLSDRYDPAFQEHMANEAKARFDYRVEGVRLANEIENLRRKYP